MIQGFPPHSHPFFASLRPSFVPSPPFFRCSRPRLPSILFILSSTSFACIYESPSHRDRHALFVSAYTLNHMYHLIRPPSAFAATTCLTPYPLHPPRSLALRSVFATSHFQRFMIRVISYSAKQDYRIAAHVLFLDDVLVHISAIAIRHSLCELAG